MNTIPLPDFMEQI